jgi:hypothetical protein
MAGVPALVRRSERYECGGRRGAIHAPDRDPSATRRAVADARSAAHGGAASTVRLPRLVGGSSEGLGDAARAGGGGDDDDALLPEAIVGTFSRITFAGRRFSATATAAPRRGVVTEASRLGSAASRCTADDNDAKRLVGLPPPPTPCGARSCTPSSTTSPSSSEDVPEELIPALLVGAWITPRPSEVSRSVTTATKLCTLDWRAGYLEQAG